MKPKNDEDKRDTKKKETREKKTWKQRDRKTKRQNHIAQRLDLSFESRHTYE